MPQSKDQQVKEIVIGVALGVLAQGVDAVTSSKFSLEFAFEHAWSRWSKASSFPSISGHNVGNLFWIGLGKSERRHGACAAWEKDMWSAPYIIFDGWTVDDALDLHADKHVAVKDWVELGRLFIDDFKPDEVRRSQEDVKP